MMYDYAMHCQINTNLDISSEVICISLGPYEASSGLKLHYLSNLLCFVQTAGDGFVVCRRSLSHIWNTGESADHTALIGFLVMHQGHVHYF